MLFFRISCFLVISIDTSDASIYIGHRNGPFITTSDTSIYGTEMVPSIATYDASIYIWYRNGPFITTSGTSIYGTEMVPSIATSTSQAKGVQYASLLFTLGGSHGKIEVPATRHLVDLRSCFPSYGITSDQSHRSYYRTLEKQNGCAHDIR